MRGLHYGVVAAAVVGLAATAVGSAFGAGGIVKAPTVGGGPIAKICGDLPTRAQCLDSSYLELCGARNSAVCAPTVATGAAAACTR